MRRSACHFALLLAALLALCPLRGAAAQTAADDSGRLAMEHLVRNLDLIEQQLKRADTTAESAGRFYDVTARARKAAAAQVENLEPQVESLQRRLDALGPLPDGESAAEAPTVTQQRAVLEEDLKRLKAQITQAKLTIVRANEIDAEVGSLTQRKRFEALFHTYPFPWSPDVWRQGGPEFLAILEEIARSPEAWWQGLEAEQRSQAVSLRVAALLILTLALGWFLRHWLISRHGRDPAEEEPSYSARLLAAIANTVARGIVPALIFAGLLYLVWSSGAEAQSLFWALMSILFAVLAFFSLAWAVPYAVLSPDLPQWRLLPVSPKNARKLGWRFTLLAALFAIGIFMGEAQARIGVSDAYFSLSTFFLNLLPALVLINTSRQRYWDRVPQAGKTQDDTESDGVEPPPTQTGPGFWRPASRRLVAVIAMLSVLASLAGYADLAEFLITNLLLSIVTLAALIILRGLAREAIGAGLRSDFMREALEIRHVARNRLKFWLRALLDAALMGIGAIVIAAIWGSPFGDFWAETRRLLSGITIGGVTISVSDLLAALLVFAAILLLTRLGQRFLGNSVLPQTGFDSGVQHSLSAGFGYVGIILAAIFGISALGIDLSNIALIAGALSVGIGFGLQAVVSNFVSGIILLIERPIKVGDWVLVGGNEGTVKRMTVRSTELTTFQRASVIIPNSDFISTAVTNWTHKDHYGRIEVPVGVAYGSDVEKVRELLLACAQKHERVLTSPEPFVLFMNFGNSSLDFELRCYTGEVSFRLVISSDLRFAIDKAFREEGIEIPFPQQVVHFAGDAAPVLPPRDQADQAQSHQDRPPQEAPEGASGQAAEGEGPQS
ncbi:MAG: mechanosensitive ion channel [Kiloniellaceae bacterium]